MTLLAYIDSRLAALQAQKAEADAQQARIEAQKDNKGKGEADGEEETGGRRRKDPETVSESTLMNLASCRRALADYLAQSAIRRQEPPNTTPTAVPEPEPSEASTEAGSSEASAVAGSSEKTTEAGSSEASAVAGSSEKTTEPEPSEASTEAGSCSAAPAAEEEARLLTDVPLLTPLVPGWLAEYRAWLADAYISPYGKRRLTPGAVQRHLQTLRTVLRSATAEGLFPNIDVFADLIDSADTRERRGVRQAPSPLWICRAAATFPDSHPLLRRLVAHHLGYPADPFTDEEEHALAEIRDHLSRTAAGRTLRHTRRNRWYALRVYGRSGTDVELQIRECSLLPADAETYAPYDTKTRVDRRGAIRQTDDTLVTRLLFVHTDAQSIKEAAHHLDKVYLYSNPDPVYGRVPAMIPARQIERLRFMLRHAPGEVEITTEFRRGMRVRVLRGPLRGFEGEVVEAPGGMHRLSLMIDHIGCATLRISPADVTVI